MNPYQAPIQSQDAVSARRTPASSFARKVVWAVASVAYLFFPILIGVREGFRDGFVPALLWPVPIVIMLFLFGAIPIWCGQFGAAMFVTVWSVECLFIVTATYVLSPRMTRSLALFAACASVALINLTFTFVFLSGIDVACTLPSSVHAEHSDDTSNRGKGFSN